MTNQQTNKEIEIYRIIDSFLVEAKDQKGNDRSLERLNQDRHLAANKFLELLLSHEKAVEEKTLSSVKEILENEIALAHTTESGKTSRLTSAWNRVNALSKKI